MGLMKEAYTEQTTMPAPPPPQPEESND